MNGTPFNYLFLFWFYLRRMPVLQKVFTITVCQKQAQNVTTGDVASVVECVG